MTKLMIGQHGASTASEYGDSTSIADIRLSEWGKGQTEKRLEKRKGRGKGGAGGTLY